MVVIEQVLAVNAQICSHMFSPGGTRRCKAQHVRAMQYPVFSALAQHSVDSDQGYLDTLFDAIGQECGRYSPARNLLLQSLVGLIGASCADTSGG